MATAAGCDDRSEHTDRRPAESYLQDESDNKVSRSPSRSNSRSRSPGDDASTSRRPSPRNGCGYGSEGSTGAFAALLDNIDCQKGWQSTHCEEK